MKKLNELFVEDINQATLDFNKQDNSKPGSKYYKPSSLGCPVIMACNRLGLPGDPSNSKADWIRCANTGTMRHVGIQEVLERMTKENYNWEYLDVAEYVNMKKEQGKCQDVRIGSKQGMETHLYDDKYHLSFMCDGIIKYKPTGEYFLFEFKNKKSYKMLEVDTAATHEHYDQLVIYCATLDLTQALLLCENRDTCELICPEVFYVTDGMKKELHDKLDYVESYCCKGEIPPKPKKINEYSCKFCQFKRYCKE